MFTLLTRQMRRARAQTDVPADDADEVPYVPLAGPRLMQSIDYGEDLLSRILRCLLSAGFQVRLNRQSRTWPQGTRPLVARLRMCLAAAICCVPAYVGLTLVEGMRGLLLYFQMGSKESCQLPLRRWLCEYLWFMVTWLFCPSLISLMTFCLTAAVVLELQCANSAVVSECVANEPDLIAFLYEAIVVNAIALAFLAIVTVAVGMAWAPLRRLVVMLRSRHPVPPEMLSRIQTLDMSAVSIGQECAICLGTEDAAETYWCELGCGHRFHRVCLFHWLHRANQCPCCRMEVDL